MAKKDNTTLFVVGALAVVGYFAFRSGGFLNKGVAQPVLSPSNPGNSSASTSLAQYKNPGGIALEMPSPETIGIYAPAVDPTGSSITLY